ncbi:MAG: hypothetical protein NTZ52_03755 [Chlamydiae bacterium]|nr:hypothetical protein [Chlamydiota bacterium]
MIKLTAVSVFSVLASICSLFAGKSVSIESEIQAGISHEYFITFTPEPIQWESKEDVRKSWAMLCCERIAKRRLLVALQPIDLDIGVYTGGKDFSPSSLSIQFHYPNEIAFDRIKQFSRDIDSILAIPVSDSEYMIIQKELLYLCSQMLKKEVSEDELFVYRCLETEFLVEASPYTFIEFLQTSSDCIFDLTASEVDALFPFYFQPVHKIEETFFPLDSECTETEDPSSDVTVEESSIARGSGTATVGRRELFSYLDTGLANENPQFGSVEGYNALRLTKTDAKNIRSILTTMSDKNLFLLLLEKGSLEKKGKQIRPVHPMRFIGFILADSQLRKCLHNIKKDYFKWSNFAEGFTDRMKEEAGKGNLLPYIHGLATLIKVDPGVIYQFISKKDYDGLLKYFI